MKFGKVLKVSSENMPSEMHDLFLRYKDLKKKIKAIPVNKDAAAGEEKQASVSPGRIRTASGNAGQQLSITATALSPEEQAFISTLNEDLARFNRFFIEKEEEAVIRLQALCDELAAAAAATGVPLPPALVAAVDADPDPAPGGAASGGAAAGAAAAARSQPPAPQVVEAPAWPQGTLTTVFGDGDGSGELGAQAAHSQDGADGQAAHDGSGSGASPQTEAEGTAGGSPASTAAMDAPPPPLLPPPSPHRAATNLQDVKSRLVRFHGEMVLLLHWSLLNYAAVVKILKKHDKRTGVLLRAPYLANVLQQPFSSTTIMSRLAKRAEELVVATTKLYPPHHHHHPHIGGRAQGQGQGAAGQQGDAAGAAAAGAEGCSAAVGAAGGEPSGVAVAAAAAGADAVSVPCSAATRAGAEGGSGTAGAGAGVGPSGAAKAGAGEVGTCGSEASTRVEEEGGLPAGLPGDNQPIMGSTMAALEVWANLRRNAITPSTVLPSPGLEAGAAGGQQAAKRKSEAGEALATEAPSAKVPRAGAEAEGQAGR